MCNSAGVECVRVLGKVKESAGGNEGERIGESEGESVIESERELW